MFGFKKPQRFKLFILISQKRRECERTFISTFCGRQIRANVNETLCLCFLQWQNDKDIGNEPFDDFSFEHQMISPRSCWHNKQPPREQLPTKIPGNITNKTKWPQQQVDLRLRANVDSSSGETCLLCGMLMTGGGSKFLWIASITFLNRGITETWSRHHCSLDHSLAVTWHK